MEKKNTVACPPSFSLERAFLTSAVGPELANTGAAPVCCRSTQTGRESRAEEISSVCGAAFLKGPPPGADASQQSFTNGTRAETQRLLLTTALWLPLSHPDKL